MPRTPVGRHAPTIVEFVEDAQLLGLSISRAQRALLKSIYGLPLDDAERDLWRACTGRDTYPGHAFSEAAVIVGARGGKDSRIAVPVLLYEAVFGAHERYLSKGERGVLPLVAHGQRGTQIAFAYARDYFLHSPMLRTLLAEEPLAQEISLTNRLRIMCFPSTQRATRGFSIPAACLDELAFFRLEGQADSDAEIQASVRRGMVGFPATRLLKVSTPYARSGILYEDFTRAFGKDDPDILVWKASTNLMNPSITEARLDRERRLDPVRFAREYLGEFAEDIESFLPSAWVDAAVMPGRHELPPNFNTRYIAACDPSGGGADAFSLAIVHIDGKDADRRIVQDVMRSWTKPRTATADLGAIIKEIAAICQRYHVPRIYGDRYAAGFVVEAFKREGLRYEPPEIKAAGADEPSYLDKSRAYVECDPIFAQARIDILDHPQLIRELKLLERRPQAGGKIRVDHPSGLHDDHANALCLAAAMAARAGARPFAGALLPAGIHSLGDPGAQMGQALGTGQAAQVARGDVAGQARLLGKFGKW